MSSQPIIIDVRQPEEFAQDHVEGAVNMPLPNLTHNAELGSIEKDAPIVVYCNSGNRSGVASKILTSQGFINITNGINASNVRADYNL